MYRLTARRKAALRKAQLISARKRKGKRRSISTRTKVAIGIGVVGAAASAGYFLDRRYNTVMMYHSTTHARARRIASEGFKSSSSRNGYGIRVNGKLIKSNETYFSVDVNNTNHNGHKISKKQGAYNFGPATISARIRKSKLKKYAKRDKSSAAQFWQTTNYIKISNADIPKLKIKPRYTWLAQKEAKKQIKSKRIK